VAAPPQKTSSSARLGGKAAQPRVNKDLLKGFRPSTPPTNESFRDRRHKKTSHGHSRGWRTVSGSTARQRDTINWSGAWRGQHQRSSRTAMQKATGHVHTRGEGVIPPRAPAEIHDRAAQASATQRRRGTPRSGPPAYANSEKGWLTPRSAGVPVRICEQAPTP
jgi:hypothetical protein